MKPTTILMHAYFEALHERLESARGQITADIEAMLPGMAETFPQAGLDIEKLDAYKEAALDFLEERIETYNPVGIQFLFHQPRSKEAFQLELQLNWYDSSEEFKQLADTVFRMAHNGVDDDRLGELTDFLINQHGAFPDRSIIRAYESAPALHKLPDYLLARALERAL